MKKLLFTKKNVPGHWVGDGFPVRSVFSYHDSAKDVSPFLLLDYAGPVAFAPASEHVRGVGSHPHRGFETVTIVYAGEVEHRDSAGGGGKIGPGDVQWMTAASGLVHEEMHGKDYAKRGGPFEMVQLWVNLPAKDKMTAPRYQTLTDAAITSVELPDAAGSLRIIAGEYAGQRGPAQTFTPVNLWDVRLRAGRQVELKMPVGFTTMVFVLSGRVQLGGEELRAAQLAVLDRTDDLFHLHALDEAKILVLGGEPIDEPVVGHGPFVMNTVQEIKQAFIDFQSGKMGQIA